MTRLWRKKLQTMADLNSNAILSKYLCKHKQTVESEQKRPNYPLTS